MLYKRFVLSVTTLFFVVYKSAAMLFLYLLAVHAESSLYNVSLSPLNKIYYVIFNSIVHVVDFTIKVKNISAKKLYWFCSEENITPIISRNKSFISDQGVKTH